MVQVEEQERLLRRHRGCRALKASYSPTYADERLTCALLPEGDGFIQRRRGRRQERDGYVGQPGAGDQCRRTPSCVPRPGPRNIDGVQNDAATRMVGENADAGANVGASGCGRGR